MAHTRRPLLAAFLATMLLAVPALADRVADDRALDPHTRLGQPVAIENLTVIPILAVNPASDDREYLTLDEAFEQKLVKVRELKNESVSSLSLENLSDRPLFVMSGEVILGGKQDRVISKERLIPPRTAAIVEVFCVEHGRWREENGSRDFRSGKTLAHSKLRVRAGFDSQDDVWKEVAAKNAKRGTSNATDTYRAVTKDRKLDKALAPYRAATDRWLAGLADKDKLIGVVIVLGGQIVAVESFGSPKLFARLRGKILASYFVEAIDHPREAKLANLGVTEVKAFLAADAAAESREVAKDGKAVIRQKKAAGTAETSVTDDKPAAAQPELYKGKHRR